MTWDTLIPHELVQWLPIILIALLATPIVLISCKNNEEDASPPMTIWRGAGESHVIPSGIVMRFSVPECSSLMYRSRGIPETSMEYMPG